MLNAIVDGFYHKIINLAATAKGYLKVVSVDENGDPLISGGATTINLEASGLALEASQQTAIEHLAAIATAQAPDKETPYILFRVKDGESFTGASSGDPIIAILTINTLDNTLVSNIPVWYNGNTKQQIADANVDTSKLVVIAANALTLSELASLGLATSAKQDTGNSSLSSIDGKFTTLNAKDFATSAKQDTGNSSLSSIDGKFTTLNAKDFATSAKQDTLQAAISNILSNYQSAQSILGERIVEQRYTQIEMLFASAIDATQVTAASANGGSTTVSNGHLVIAAGTSNNTGSASVTSVESIVYKSGHEIFIEFTAAFTANANANTYQRIGLYNAANGIALNMVGSTMNLLLRSNSVDTNTAISSANIDTLSAAVGSKFTRAGTPEAINWAYKNLFRLRFAWFGIAPIVWEVLSPDGDWVAFHKMRYPNSQILSHILTPNLPCVAEVNKSAGSGAGNVQLYVGCIMAGVTSQKLRLIDTINDNYNVDLTRAIIAGRSAANTYNIANVDSSGNLSVTGNIGVSTASPFELVFYSSSSYTIPKNGYYNVHAIGGGGGGALTTSGSLRRVSGGGAGGYTRKRIYLYAGDVLTITIGAGGAALSVTGNGNNGGNTTVVCVARSLSLTANGGTGGTQATTTGTTTGATGGTASGGDVNYTGGAAGNAIVSNTASQAYSGGGAVNLFGTAYNGGIANSNSTTSAVAASGGAGVGGNGGDATATSAAAYGCGGGVSGSPGAFASGANGDGIGLYTTILTIANAWNAKSFFDVSGAGAYYNGTTAVNAGRGGGGAGSNGANPGVFGGGAYYTLAGAGLGGGGGGQSFGSYGAGGNGVVVVQFEG